MLSVPFRRVFTPIRYFNTTKQNNLKVSISGASGLVGQPLSLLLKQCPLITELKLHGVENIRGMVADLSHVETPAKVFGFEGSEQAEEAFEDADIIIIVAGAPRTPGIMSTSDIFKGNAPIVCNLAKAVAKAAPNALIAVISNPLNSTVPIVAEVLKQADKFDPRRLFGVSTLNNVRANTFVAEMKHLNPLKVKVPVIGGNSAKTVIPVISQATPSMCCSEQELKQLSHRLRYAGREVAEIKAVTGPARLSMSYSAARFIISIMRAMKGDRNIVECAYVPSDITEAKYFATPLLLGKCGLEKNLGLGKLSPFEEKLLCKALPELQHDIELGENFVKP